MAEYPCYVVAKHLIKQGIQDKREAGEFSKIGEGQIVQEMSHTGLSEQFAKVCTR